MKFSILVHGHIDHFPAGHTASVDAAGNLSVYDVDRNVVHACTAGSWIILPDRTVMARASVTTRYR